MTKVLKHAAASKMLPTPSDPLMQMPADSIPFAPAAQRDALSTTSNEPGEELMGKDAEKLVNRKGEVLFEGESQVSVAPGPAKRASWGYAVRSVSAPPH